MTEATRGRVFDVIAENRGVSAAALSEEQDLASDLGIDGSDAEKILTSLRVEFRVDFSAFEFSRYSFADGSAGLGIGLIAIAMFVSMFIAAFLLDGVEPMAGPHLRSWTGLVWFPLVGLGTWMVARWLAGKFFGTDLNDKEPLTIGDLIAAAESKRWPGLHQRTE